MSNDWKFISATKKSFAGFPTCSNLDDLQADIVVLGTHYASPYPKTPSTIPLKESLEEAPASIRRQSSIFIDHLSHYNFDFNGDTLAGKDIRLVDCGDVDRDTAKDVLNPEHITLATRKILSKGAIPFILGTDEGNSIFILRGYEGFKSLCVIHLDAHIDWRDEREGVKNGSSSGMKRASEMPWIESMAQIGLRGIGSARQKEIDDARAFRSVFVRARDLHQKGIADCIDRIPTADHYVIVIDSDVFDIPIATGVRYKTPGGLSYDETTDLVEGIADKGKIVGIHIFGLRPVLDTNDVTASMTAQLIINFIGTIAHSQSFKAG